MTDRIDDFIREEKEKGTVYLIACYAGRSAHPLAAVVKCENCACTITAWPVSVAKQKDKGYHLVCHDCYRAVVRRLNATGKGVPIVFGGRIRGNKFPDEPK